MTALWNLLFMVENTFFLKKKIYFRCGPFLKSLLNL